MSFFHSGYIPIILSSTAVYLFIVLAIRLFGKTEIAQLSRGRIWCSLCC
jgi:uncharacterized membrane protein YcaP (DUF421 family)